MRQIPLRGRHGEGKFALVDDEDYEAVSRHKWRIHYDRRDHFAVVTTLYGDNWRDGHTTLRIHQLIMGQPGIDHKDGNCLNNTRANLRLATQAQNMKNRRASGKCIYLGVHRHGTGWMARVKFDVGRKSVGTFPTPEEAAHNYDYHARLEYGEFAKLNFPNFDYTIFKPKVATR